MRESKSVKELLFRSTKDVFKDTKKIVLLAVLSAISSILFLFEIPYPPVPFLSFDISDLPVILAAQTLGVGPAIIVAITSTLVRLMIRGINSPMGIGLIVATISSITIAILYVYLNKHLKGMRWYQRGLRFVVILTIYSSFMTLANFLFVTPIFVGGLWFTDVIDWLTLSTFIPNLTFNFIQPITLFGINIDLPTIGFTIPDFGYLATIIIIYMPFNALKGFTILAIYEMIEPRLLPEIKKIIKI